MQRLIYIVRSLPPSQNNHPHLNVKGNEQDVTAQIIEELIAREHIRSVFVDPLFLSAWGEDHRNHVFDNLGWSLDALVRNLQAMIPRKKPQDHGDLMVYPLVLADPFSSANGNSSIVSQVYRWLRDKAIYHVIDAHGGERNLLVVTQHHELRDFYQPTSGFAVVGINIQRHNGTLSYEMHAYNGAEISRELTGFVQEQIKRV